MRSGASRQLAGLVPGVNGGRTLARRVHSGAGTLAADKRTGVRPSLGAAGQASTRTLGAFRTSRAQELAAPGDGRTPVRVSR